MKGCSECHHRVELWDISCGVWWSIMIPKVKGSSLMQSISLGAFGVLIRFVTIFLEGQEENQNLLGLK